MSDNLALSVGGFSSFIRAISYSTFESAAVRVLLRTLDLNPRYPNSPLVICGWVTRGRMLLVIANGGWGYPPRPLALNQGGLLRIAVAVGSSRLVHHNCKTLFETTKNGEQNSGNLKFGTEATEGRFPPSKPKTLTFAESRRPDI